MASNLNENENDILESVLHALQVIRDDDAFEDMLYNALDDLTRHARYWLVHDRGIKEEVFI